MDSNQRQLLDRGLSACVPLAAAMAAMAVAAEYGFEQPPLPLAVLRGAQLLAVSLGATAGAVHLLDSWSNRADRWRQVVVPLILLAVVVCAAVLGARWGDVLLGAAIYVVLNETRRLLGLLSTRLYGEAGGQGRRPRPAQVMLLSFAIMIVAGGTLLSLPRSMSAEKRLEDGYYVGRRIVNCFFTATSAACVTGLVVYDTGQDFSHFGQLVILVLMQLGGLGIMIFGSVFGLLLRRRLSLREALVLQDIYSHHTIGAIGQMIKFICGFTVVVEAVAAVLLYDMWPAEVGGPGVRWFYSAFCAVSAFCNAGFAPSATSLIPYRGAWQVYSVIMPAIVLGGIGFPVLADLIVVTWRRGGQWLRRRFAPLKYAHVVRGAVPRVSLHTKLVLVSTAVLIVLPAAMLFTFESVRGDAPGQVSASAMASLGPGQRLASALFQSITCRTAGFNTVSTAPQDLSNASLFLMCILMFIGGSPASAAGGAKTVTIAVLILGLIATLRKREGVEAFHRHIPIQTIRQSATVTVAMLALVSFSVLLLCVTEAVSLTEILFEVVSACGTVGLSTGLTPHLTIAGKIIIMLAMLAGRLGPLTLLIALTGDPQEARYDYPTEQVVIG